MLNSSKKYVRSLKVAELCEIAGECVKFVGCTLNSKENYGPSTLYSTQNHVRLTVYPLISYKIYVQA